MLGNFVNTNFKKSNKLLFLHPPFSKKRYKNAAPSPVVPNSFQDPAVAVITGCRDAVFRQNAPRRQEFGMTMTTKGFRGRRFFYVAFSI